MLALKISNARKNYKDVHALKGIDLNVPKGEFFGLLGPNGAGKTTLIQAIVGLVRLTAGHIEVFGHDVVKEYKQARKKIGYSPQEINLGRFFKLERLLKDQAGYFGIPKERQQQLAKQLLEQFGLTEKAQKQAYRLSGGMQKRALIAKALVSEPDLLILDEPTAGVDVEQRHELWAYLQKLNQLGTTIILTTHYIDEAQALCERIGIINLGEIKELGSPKELMAKYCQTQLTITTNKTLPENAFAQIKNFKVTQEGHKITALGNGAGVMTQDIIKTIRDHKEVVIEDIAVNKGSLEDVFLKLTGKTFLEMETPQPNGDFNLEPEAIT